MLDDGERIQNAASAILGDLLNLEPLLIDRLRQSPRTAPRLAGVVTAKLGQPATLTAGQAKLLSMNALELRDFARLAGSVRHAHAVLGLLDGEKLRDFCQRAGTPARAAALRWNKLVANAPVLPVMEALEDELEQEGWRVLRAWCRRQPAAIGGRLDLSLPPATVRDGPEIELATLIVDTLAHSHD